jgi:hypothetical protein
LKWHWVEKCCNKFKKPTGDLGDPKRGMILRCQRIQKRIHAKTSSTIMGIDSDGDEGLAVSNEEEESSEEEEEGMAVAVEDMAAEEEVAGIGSVTNSRIGTPTNFVDGVGDGGLVIMSSEEVGVAPVPPLPPPTQQSTERSFWHVPHYQQTHQQLLFLPEALLHPQQLPVQTAAIQVVQ